MLDIHAIRKESKEIEAKLKTKDPSISLSEILLLDERTRRIRTQGEELKSKRNTLSKQIGEYKRKGEDASPVMEEVAGIGDEIAKLDKELAGVEEALTSQLLMLPNIPMDGIKNALDPEENVCIKTHLEKPQFDFEPKNHLELNETVEYLDFKRGAKLSGTGWPVYRGMGARIEWALHRYMLDVHMKNGFEPWIPPFLVRPEILQGSAQLPKFEDQQFKITDDDYQLYLIPTAETALNGLHFDEILEADSLPRKYVSQTPCFRREAGAAGAGERGLIRVHQFNKVEMFAFTHADESEAMFQTFMDSAEEVLQGLGMHYRNMELVTGDMSFAAAKTVDIEVWLPGQNRYYEVSSVSNCTDFQARRSKIRAKKGNEKPELVHTLNGSGLATARLLVAIMENGQKADGTIELPTALTPYL